METGGCEVPAGATSSDESSARIDSTCRQDYEHTTADEVISRRRKKQKC